MTRLGADGRRPPRGEEGRKRDAGGKNKSKPATAGGEDDADNDNDAEEVEQEIDRQYLQMATSLCGSRHCAMHFLNLSLNEDSLGSFHSTLLALGGQDPADGNGMRKRWRGYSRRSPRSPTALDGLSSLRRCWTLSSIRPTGCSITHSDWPGSWWDWVTSSR
jgi:hypothetical protein